MARSKRKNNQYENTSLVDLGNSVAKCNFVVTSYYKSIVLTIFSSQNDYVPAQSIWISDIDNLKKMKNFISEIIDNYDKAVASVKIDDNLRVTNVNE